ncbi:MAG TPA: hypothetical protein PK358_09625 [Spirochaetota bacterium]|nr:hypothetical protein [Spirochaetota bacterium]
MPDNIPSQYRHVIELDRSLRKNVAEYFFALNDMKDPGRAVELLAGHVAIMVEMINELKKKL